LEIVDNKAKDNGESNVGGEQIDRNTQKDSAKVKENPFWFEDIIKDAEQHYSHPDAMQHYSHHHHNKRAKRNHRKKVKSMRHVDTERILAKRSVDYDVGDMDYQQDEVFSASEVIGNIFNENDTLTGYDGFGKDNGE
jgi:hypothetical protein